MNTLKYQISRKIPSFVCALVACLAAGPGAFAQNATDTWVGNTTANLSDSNWTGGNNPPIAGDNWVFGAAGTAGAVLDNSFGGGISVSNILFSPGASAFTFFDNPISVINTLSNSSTALQTFNGDMNLTGSVTTVGLNAGGGDITIGGMLTGSSPLTLSGGGKLTLTNVNTGFSGALALSNNATLTLSGAGTIGAGSGPYVWTPPQVGAGVSFRNNGLVVYSSSATTTFNARSDGTGGITVNGPGTFISSPGFGGFSWGFTGPLTVNGGIYSCQKPLPGNGRSGFGDTGVNSPGGERNNVSANNGGILSVDADQAFGQGGNIYVHHLNFVINTNSVLQDTTGNSLFSKIFLNGGTALANNGSMFLSSSITTAGGLPSFMTGAGSGGFYLGVGSGGSASPAGYQTPFVVNPTPAGSGAGGADLTVAADLRNANANRQGFTLSGGGTMLLTGTTTFTGPISVTQGQLILGDPGLLGSGDFLGNVNVSSGATFTISTTQQQFFEGALSGAGSLVLSDGVVLYLENAASTVSPLSLVISNGAILDVELATGSSVLGSTVMGFGEVSGNVTTAAGALIKGGIPGTYGTLSIVGNLNMAVGAAFDLAVSTSAAGSNSRVTVSGNLTNNNTQVHLTAPSTAVSLDTQNYTLVTSAGFSGSVSPAPIWDVAPANANHYFVTNINNNIVLAYSSTEILTPSGSSSPANVLRNQTPLLVLTAVPGSGQTISSVTVDASSLGGSSTLALVANGVANTFTNSVLIIPTQAPGTYLLPATASDTTPATGYGNVVVNVIASTEKWAGLGGDQNFDTAANWAIQAGQTAAYPPAYSGDSLLFAGLANLTPVMNNPYSINGLSFTNGAGAFNLTASGGNVLTLAAGSVVNLSTNLETLNLPVLSSLAGAVSVNASNGNLTLGGGFADNNGGLMVNGPLTNTFTLAGPNTFTGPLVLRRGTMALASSLTETNAINVADLAGSAAALKVVSGGNLAVADGLNILIGAGNPSVGAMSVGAGGSLSIPSGVLNLGNGFGSSAYFNMTGGNVGVNSFVNVAGLGDHARFDMSGGTFTISNDVIRLGNQNGSPYPFGEANFSGGTFNSLNSETTAGFGGGMLVAQYGTGTLNVSGNAVLNIWGENNLVLSVNPLIASGFITGRENGTVNLLGGTIVTAGVTGGTGPSSVFNFNGGSLSNYNGSINYFASAPPAYFMYNLSNAYVYPGGAFIDDGGGSITINQALQAPSGYGVSAITVTNGGANYFAPPYVDISGGSGAGATASAVVSGGKVTAINVTCPGSGYASGEKLTFTLIGGGGTGAGATNNALVANGSGGLTYTSQAGSGLGTLTLIAPATYTNTTVVKSGTLIIGVGGSISNSSGVSIGRGATFDVSQLSSPYVWPAASSVSGSGSAASPALINSAGAVTLSSSSAVILTYNNTNTAPQPALNITGTLSLGGNAFTVNTANGSSLADGTNVLVQATDTITSGGNYPAVTGTGISSRSRGAISVSGQQVILTVSPISTVPPTITSSLSGTVLTLTWPPDHLGYILQSNSINLAVSTAWFNISGSSSVTNFPTTVQPGKSNVFFRLVLP